MSIQSYLMSSFRKIISRHQLKSYFLTNLNSKKINLKIFSLLLKDLNPYDICNAYTSSPLDLKCIYHHHYFFLVCICGCANRNLLHHKIHNKLYVPMVLQNNLSKKNTLYLPTSKRSCVQMLLNQKFQCKKTQDEEGHPLILALIA